MWKNLFGGKKAEEEAEPEALETEFEVASVEEEPARVSIFDRMKQAVTRTRESLSSKIEGVIALTRVVDESALDELEAALLTSDLGMPTTTAILEQLRDHALRKDI